MYARIVADSINDYNDRLTTYFVTIPYVCLIDFYKFKDINISFKFIKHKKFKPLFDKNVMDDYKWSSGIDLISSIDEKYNIVNLSITYVSCIMTSTKWHQFFTAMYDSNLVLSYNQSNAFVELIDDMENRYIDNVKNVSKLKENEWHASNIVKDIVKKAISDNSSLFYSQTLIQYQYYAYYHMNTALNGNINYDDAKKIFSSTFNHNNSVIYNHIAKVPVEYDYLTNGYFDSKWNSKLRKMIKPYNIIYDSYLCLYDIILERKQKLDFN